MSRSRFFRYVKTLSLAAVMLGIVCPVWAQTDIINTTADSGTGSYRQAVLDENAGTASNALVLIGLAGSSAGVFASPAGVAVSPLTGNIYVLDTGNNRVQIFSPN
jgi:DNA-binding beta-propeller fold protein YncE